MKHAWLVLLLSGCSSTPATTDAGTDDGSASDSTTSDSPSPDSGGPTLATFSYKPQWKGVNKVEVVGGFGQATDWSKTASLATLSDDGTGTWKGSVQLPNGTYLYVFRVTGDDDTSQGAKYVRYAVDPMDPAFADCPMESPTFDKNAPNPCSQLVVPQVAPATPIHVKGKLLVGGMAATGWLVEIERMEPMKHHFFANRVTADANGFDLVAAAGSYRLQALHPKFYEATDLQLDPKTQKTLRRAISSAFVLSNGDVTVAGPDLAFDKYNQYAPTNGTASLPTQFTFQNDGPTRLAVYGGNGDGGVVEIGDPWYAGQATMTGMSTFDGTFNTKQSMQDAAAPGIRYMWGTEEAFDAGIVWTKQTMVFPITWQ